MIALDPDRRGGGREAQGIAGEGGASVLVCEAALRVGKVRYRGLAKNTQRIALLLGFSNLLIRDRITRGPWAARSRHIEATS